MKTAKCSVWTFEVTCPHCEEATRDPIYDSYQWVVDESPKITAGTVQECSECGQEFKLPKVVANNRLYVVYSRREWQELESAV